MLKIRLQRGGSTHHPHYRIVVADSRAPRDGKFVEKIGTYDPKNKNPEKQVNVQLERAEYWLSVGAQPSDTVRSMIRKARRDEKYRAPGSAVAEEAPAAAETPATEEKEEVATAPVA